MKSILSAVKNFAADENGVTAIEYALMAALIGIVMAVGATLLGSGLSASFSTLADKIAIAP